MSDVYVRVEGLSDSLLNNVTVKEVTENPYKAFGKALLSVKVADLLCLVRCKDCKWWEEKSHICKQHSNIVFGLMCETGDKDYCSEGERKEQDQE